MIYPSALPNRLSPEALHLAAGEPVNPERAGWRYLSFQLLTLEAGASIDLGGPDTESVVVTLSGGVHVGDLELPGRPTVWEGGPWAAYLPPRVNESLAADAAATVAVASAPASDRGEPPAGPIVIGPSDVQVEVRGAGNATRQINHIITPSFPAGRLLVVEVYTPSGNWSSWPPHKHDTDRIPEEAVLEEIYCYQFRRPEAWGIQRLYRPDRSRDALWEVRHGEVVLVTDGYHPFVAAHGDDAYYLNVLAGDRRTMACSFDPDLDWVRSTWATEPKDPRVPLVSTG